MPDELKKWARDKFSSAKLDVYGMFIERTGDLAKPCGRFSLITMQAWMFLSSCEGLRKRIFDSSLLTQMFHTGPGVFPELGAFNVLTTVFVLFKHEPISGYSSCFIKANQSPEIGNKLQSLRQLESHICEDVGVLKQVPGFPIIYWLSRRALSNFSNLPLLGDVCPPRQGMATTDNGRFVRRWHEIDILHIAFGCRNASEGNLAGKNWFPYNKSGNYRKWFGNNEHVVLYEDDGAVLLDVVSRKYPKIGNPYFVIKNRDFYFKKGIVYSLFGFENFGVRYKEHGFIFDVSGSSIFPATDDEIKLTLAYLASSVAFFYLRALAPTVNFQVGDLARLPLPQFPNTKIRKDMLELAESCIALSQFDWDMHEVSWTFETNVVLSKNGVNLEASWAKTESEHSRRRGLLRANEEQINQMLIDVFGLESEVEPTVNDRDLTIKELSKQDTMEELVSYAIGCMMGRYSLDAPGLIYAHSGNEGFDPSQYTTFPADHDAIIPILEGNWFTDDIVERMKEFLKVTFGTENYEENLRYLEDGLYPSNLEGKKRKTIREYFLKDFYNNHVQTYKKRPIYWLFSSPKGSFNALIYLHRYRSDTVSTVLNDYLRNFRTKLTARLDNEQTLAADAGASKSDKTKALKETERLKKMLTELEDWEREVLYPLAAEKLEIDLDDGVKHNYPLFGKALKKIPGLS